MESVVKNDRKVISVMVAAVVYNCISANILNAFVCNPVHNTVINAIVDYNMGYNICSIDYCSNNNMVIL